MNSTKFVLTEFSEIQIQDPANSPTLNPYERSQIHRCSGA